MKTLKPIYIMKKFFTLAAIVSMVMPLNAATEETIFLDGFYAHKFSRNYAYLASQAGGTQIYEMATGEITNYTDCELGEGNSVADNGWAVGTRSGYGVLMRNGRASVPMCLRDSWMSSIEGITPDGSRITGFVSNPNVSSNPDYTEGPEASLVPFYCDVDEEGNVGDLHILPYPERDFLGYVPQYIRGQYISEDGKTIIAQMTDNYGRMSDPVMFTEQADGSWERSLPTYFLFNPEHVVLPENPYENEPEAPDPRDFMSESSYEDYYNALVDWYDDPNSTEEDAPDPRDWMTRSEMERYDQMVQEFLDYWENHEQLAWEFEQAYVKILQTSPMFTFNGLAMSADFKTLAAHDSHAELDGNAKGSIYIFDLDEKEEYRRIGLPDSFTPHQILDDGTIIGVTGLLDGLRSFILLPGQDSFIPMETYFDAVAPVFASWMHQVIPNGCGMVSANDDLTLFAGGLSDENYSFGEESDVYYYTSYILKLNEEDGVEVVKGMDNSAIRVLGGGQLAINGDVRNLAVYDLSGRKLFSLPQAQGAVETGLSTGLYIVKGVGADGNEIVLKVRM